ncbi:Stage V sporulation protein involved in spore cortex synthesis (SpoVR) [Salmonella enterica subsp. enterica]|uniref:Stage V sporulation protein involved in spore cortex synthesis (SpoVR) n=1 Tax=Salmonella enterica I TaxID=59201 RepID=A0A447U205_SALET|nr:Stage V sporulation protein involved in spore cortex synthesis (SpoVR) [Salmonella enterica subsp. enterica]
MKALSGQFLSPKVMRDFRFFTVLDDDRHNYLEISAIHNEEGYREIRSKLSSQYNLSNLEPNIQVWKCGFTRRQIADVALYPA